MTDLNPSIDAELVLRHQPFLRSIARRLVRDEAEVDDAVQDAWLRALERGPTKSDAPGALSLWLATTLRRRALTRRQRESERPARERLAARPESADASDATEADTDLAVQEHLAQALRALPEAYRTTLWLRYFQDLSPTQIAARQGVPVATVKSRLKRGLAGLRERLDAEFGARRAWCTAFLGFAAAGERTARAAAPAALPFVAVAAVAVALIAGAALAVRHLRSPSAGGTSEGVVADRILHEPASLADAAPALAEPRPANAPQADPPRLAVAQGSSPEGDKDGAAAESGGVVRTALGAAPDGDAVVLELTRGAVAGVPRNTTGFSRGAPLPAIERTQRAAKDGTFELGALKPGRWTLRARWGEWVAVDVNFDAPLAERLEVVLPPTGALVLTVLVPDDADARGLGIQLRPVGGPKEPRGPGLAHGGPSLGTPLPEEGPLVFEPLPAGEVDVLVAIRTILGPGSTSWKEKKAATVRIAAGARNEAKIDAGKVLPLVVTLLPTLEGAPLAGARLALFRDDLPRAMPETATADEHGVAALRLDPRTWRIAVMDPQGLWVAVLPEPRTVGRGTATEVVTDVALVACTVRVVDAAGGAPRANTTVGFATGPERFTARATGMTDADGRVEIALPAGEVRIDAGGAAKPLAWPRAPNAKLQVAL